MTSRCELALDAHGTAARKRPARAMPRFALRRGARRHVQLLRPVVSVLARRGRDAVAGPAADWPHRALIAPLTLRYPKYHESAYIYIYIYIVFVRTLSRVSAVPLLWSPPWEMWVATISATSTCFRRHLGIGLERQHLGPASAANSLGHRHPSSPASPWSVIFRP